MPLTSAGGILRAQGHTCNGGKIRVVGRLLELKDEPIMTLKDNIKALRGDPAALERLYRSAQAEGNEEAFSEALRQCRAAYPDHLLLEAWAHRLGVPVAPTEQQSRADRRWWVVIGASVLLGVVSAVLANGKVPVPVPDPDETEPLFWVGWGPLVALGLLAYLAWSERSGARLSRFAVAAFAVMLVALYVGLTLGARTDDAAVLGAVHLPLVAWALVGGALCLGYTDPARQAYAYLVKSVETVLTGGIFFGAGVVFIGLTFGIFAVLGIELPEEDLMVVGAWAIGALPLLALGTAYDPAAPPAAQDWEAGMTRTLRILARLLLPLALGVLLVYVLWFIPAYFRKPFEEREVLFVYNATVLAILVLLTVVVSGPADEPLFTQSALFRYAVLGLGMLTLILNAYALAAVLGRTLEAGLTPNRFAVIGWNVTTLLVMASVGVQLWKARGQRWMPVFRKSIGLFAVLPAAWAVLLLIMLPLFH